VKVWLSSIAAGMALAFASGLALPLVRVPSESMEPSLQPGRLVLLEVAKPWLHRQWPAILAPGLDQIVVFRLPPERGLFIKRVVGLPGDRVRIVGGTFYRNGRAVTENFVKYRGSQSYNWPSSKSTRSITVPAGMVFVLGDNRPGSVDSRVFGSVPEANIIAYAVMELP
jgi:signal peptidase I